MMRALLTLARPALLTLPPETAHEVALKSLEAGLFPRPAKDDDKRLAQTFWGLNFPNPIGIAAGFDKNGRVPDALLQGGFGYAEAGTVTPRPQSGNPTPRVFRLIKDRALINRLGFNNDGHEALYHRLLARKNAEGGKPEGVVGVNIGANKDSSDRIADYSAGIHRFHDVADYFTVNISSPNTPGLRDLQAPKELDTLLTAVLQARDEYLNEERKNLPVLVKLAPDIAQDDLFSVLDVLERQKIDGIIISNTTLSRQNLLTDKEGQPIAQSKEAGGLSGAPLHRRSTIVLAKAYRHLGGSIPLIGVGGIHDGQSAVDKIEAGASLLQLYTGLIYEGAGLLDNIKHELVKKIESSNKQSLSALTGHKAKDWAQQDYETETTR